MQSFTPDYRNIVDAARNIKPQRLPLYEHIISEKVMEQILGKSFAALYNGDHSDRRQFMRCYIEFFCKMGYDTVSFERCIGPVMPGSGALGRHKEGVIKTRADFDRYPWDKIPDLFFAAYNDYFRILRAEMPPGMKAIGGPGNGVFELVQDVVGYMQLCYIRADDPKLYADLFQAVGQVMYSIWERFLQEFGDVYAVGRFGDDLGFKVATLLPPEDIRKHIIPQYKRIIDLVHAHGKPFLFHSCGNIIEVMDDLIDEAGIDAKHSNEDVIAPFSFWVDNYGDRIGNFGGIDTDILCREDEQTIAQKVQEVVDYTADKGGFALGSGNSIPDYVPVEGYLAMVQAGRRARGE